MLKLPHIWLTGVLNVILTHQGFRLTLVHLNDKEGKLQCDVTTLKAWVNKIAVIANLAWNIKTHSVLLFGTLVHISGIINSMRTTINWTPHEKNWVKCAQRSNKMHLLHLAKETH